MDYSQKTIKQLVEICKEHGIRGYGGKSQATIASMVTTALAKTPATNTVVYETVPVPAPEPVPVPAPAPEPTKLRMIDLFAGTGAFTHAFQATGKVECVFANDMVQASKDIYDLNYDHKLTLKDLNDVKVDEIPAHDILTGGFPCFVAGTKVLTQNGYKAIETVDFSDTLFTHTGTFQRILNKQMKGGCHTIHSIDIQYHPHVIACTSEHPFYVRKRARVWNNAERKYVHGFGLPVWLPASLLTDEHFTGLPVDTQALVPTQSELTNFINNTNKESWFQIGYDLYLSNFMYIPEWVQSAPKSVVEEFLRGYQMSYESNNIEKCNNQFTSVSYNVVYGIQRLYLKLGKFCSVTMEGSMYILRVINDDTLGESTSFIEDSYAWFQVKSNTVQESEPQVVYNFEVEHDNSYCVENTIVHNCQPFSIAGRQEGFEDKRSNVFWKILEILEHHQPRCVVLENVKNLLSHGMEKPEKPEPKPKKGQPGYVEPLKKGDPGYVKPEPKPKRPEYGPTFTRIKAELEARGYNVQFKVLNTAKITGVPQHRERIYIVCLKNPAIAQDFNLNFPEIQKAPIATMLQTEQPAEKYYYTEEKNNTLRDPKVEETIVGDTEVTEVTEVTEEEPVQEDEEVAEHQEAKERRTVWSLVSEAITKQNTIYQYRRVYVRENKSDECPTLTANMGGGGHNVPLILDSHGIRKLVPRECFNFQGFPASYKLPAVCDSNLYKLAGNAVSVPVVKLIANRLVPFLLPA